MSSSSTTEEQVGYPLQQFERRLAVLEKKAAVAPERLAFYGRSRGRRTHQFYFDRFLNLRGAVDGMPLLQEAEATRDGNRGAAHNYLTHGLHSYKGKFYPQLVRALLNSAGTTAPAAVVDPFVGSGTTTLEASLMGFAGYGIDRNPLAALISRTKSDALTLDPGTAESMAAAVESHMKTAKPAEVPNASYLERWFPSQTLGLVARIFGAIERAKLSIPLRDVARLTLSSLLRNWSLQVPAQLRLYRRDEAPDAASLEKRFISDLRRMSALLSRSCALLAELDIERGEVIIVEGDARDAGTWKGPDFDALVTSPPYATALPYIDTDRLSIYALGLDDVGERSGLEWSMIGNREIRKRQKDELEAKLHANEADLSEPIVDQIAVIKRKNEAAGAGFRRQNLPALLYRYFADMKSVLANANESLKPNALCAIVVGDSFTNAGGQRVQIRTADFLCLIGSQLGFEIEERIEMGGQVAYLPHQRNGIPSEEILILRSGRP